MTDPVAGNYPAHLACVCSAFDNALRSTGYDSVLVYSGHAPTAFLDDRTYPFIANPMFKWWVPLPHHERGFVRYTPGKKPVLVYHRPADYWHKPPPPPAGFWVDGFDVHVVADADATRASLPNGNGRVAYLGEWADSHAGLTFAAANPADLIATLHEARTVKTAYEIGCMRMANRVGAAGHSAAAAAFRDGATEYQIHLAYLAATGHTDDELPYNNIVALNENGATLHYTNRERSGPADARSFLIDAGASHGGYAADITRTWSRAANDDFAGLIDAMDKVQLALCAGATAGADYVALNDHAHRAVSGVLADAGLVKLPAETIAELGISRTFLPHGLGHFIGLQVHDVAGQVDTGGRRRPPPDAHPFLRLTRVLQSGNVATIEPGLYFIDMKLAELRASAHGRHVAWKKVDAMRPYGGIRIEDDIVVTSAGPPQNLTREAFAPVS